MRRNKFTNIPNLDVELDSIVSSLLQLTGKKVNELPIANQTPEMARFIKKVSDGVYQEYIKVDGGFRLLGGSGGGSGDSYIELRIYNNYIQWRSEPDGSWTNLISINDLEGPAGPTGPAGPIGPQGPAGPGVASGGTTGQVLKKASNNDYDTVWMDESGGGISDGNKGDITVSNNGDTWTINNNAITEAKINDNEVSEAKLKLSDNTIANADSTKHGLMPKLPNDPNKFINGVGQWVNIAVIITMLSIIPLGMQGMGVELISFYSGNGIITS